MYGMRSNGIREWVATASRGKTYSGRTWWWFRTTLAWIGFITLIYLACRVL